jgi:hypothetical protein
VWYKKAAIVCVRVVRRTGRGGGGGQFIKISVRDPSLPCSVRLGCATAVLHASICMCSLPRFQRCAGAPGELEHDEAASQKPMMNGRDG